MVKHVGERWVLVKTFEGEPKESDFKLVKEELDDLKDGEIIYETEFIAVDPWQRVFVGKFKVSFEER